jgi:hypothetical protein
MNKPNDFENVQGYEEFVPLELGGHYLKIVSVKEVQSSTGKAMIKIAIDTASTDAQPGYYQKIFDADKRPDKKWPNGAVVNQLIYDNDGNTNRGFKTFITAVEKSNPGFAVQWGDDFAKCFKGRFVGGVFGREEYISQKDGQPKFATKCMQFRSFDAIAEGVEIPKDKLLPATQNIMSQEGGFLDLSDDDLPF